MLRLFINKRKKPRDWRPRRDRESGFTLVEVLTVAFIIGILATMAVVSMRGGKRVAFETRAIAAVKNIAENETMFYQRHYGFGTWNEMEYEGDLIDPGYAKVDDMNTPYDTPIANLYSCVVIVVKQRQTFTAVAYPRANSLWHMRTFAVTSDGSIMNSQDHGWFFSLLSTVHPLLDSELDPLPH
ncbi:MAG: type II secretion system protein [bacterium]|nr:type II secretion system protein [bacterium]